MNVTKDIDIKMLKDMLGNMIERCQTSLKPKVELDYNTAIRIYDVLEETQIREEKHQTLESACTFMEMEDGTQTNEFEYYNNIEKTIEEGSDDWNTTRKQMELHEKMTKMVANFQKERENKLQQKCDECFFKDYELCECMNNSGSEFCSFRPLCFMNYGRDNISKCISCTFGDECEWKSNNKAPSKKEPKLRKEWEKRVKHAKKCYSRYEVEKAKKECPSFGVLKDINVLTCQWCDAYNDCLKAGRKNEQKNN